MEEKYIKYKRFVEDFIMDDYFEKNLQTFFDTLITDGFEIIYYHEEIKSIIRQKGLNDITENTLVITIVAGKKQQVI